MKTIIKYSGILCVSLIYTACTLPKGLSQRKENTKTPGVYNTLTSDSTNTARTKWVNFYKDDNLKSLIETALQNNQELNILLQEINLANNEVRARKGAYLPFLGIGVGAGIERSGKFTRNGVVDNNLDFVPGQTNPDPLADFGIGLSASWEIDIWKKLRNSRKSAIYNYLATQDGRNFAITNLVAEIANSYYELMALDNQLDILKQNIEIQQNALEIVKLEKAAARVTELAVRRFEAEVLKNQGRQYYIMQKITETENRINFLTGRFPQPIQRNSQGFANLIPDSIRAGIPSQLLQYRPDIRQAERQLMAARLDVSVAKAQFYPSLNIMAGVGYQAFKPQYLIKPESMIYSLAGQLMAPLLNRNAIKAYYYSATSRQVQAAYNYERSILNGYVEVANQVSNIANLKRSYDFKTKQVLALTQSIDISTGLFKSARADYMEVLLTQRDALEARFELVETKLQQMKANVNIYRALGGGI